ncbi:MAG: hypothetical protein IPP71_18125 [Bacteroidetes bacterium]|nr:hypothetical protein [Bacteroidota bacterium]
MIQFEHKKKKLLPVKTFLNRVLLFSFYASAILLLSLLIGIFGYHFLGNLSWMDALVNAAMILTGMGPVDRMTTVAGKLFTSFFALYSGVAFLSTSAVLFAPIIHRFLHALHIDEASSEN